MNRIIVLDTETTGLSVINGGRVIEIGAVALENGEVVAEFETLVNTGTPVTHSAYRVHRISRAMLADKPKPQEVWPIFRQFVGDLPLVSHNAWFDKAFILNELALTGIAMTNNWHCTVRLARSKLPHLPNHCLETVYRCLFGELPKGIKRHRAIDDARMAARIWVELGG